MTLTGSLFFWVPLFPATSPLSIIVHKVRYYDNAEENRAERERIQENFRLFAREQRFASLEFFRTVESYRPKLIHRNRGTTAHM